MTHKQTVPVTVSEEPATETVLDFGSLPDEMVLALAVAERIEEARGEGEEAVAAFGEHVFGYAPAAHHRAWIRERLENRRVAIMAPPESAKTTWSEILVAWWIGKHPTLSNGFVAVGDTAAQKKAGVVERCIEFNPRWKEVFPNVVPDKERGWSREGWWVRDAGVEPAEWARKTAGQKDPTLVAGGVGAAVWAGVRITGILDLDDIHDRESMTSEAKCRDTVGFFKDTALPRVTDDAHLCIEQTRWSPQDVIAYVKSLPHFKVFEHPALNEAGESYWPEQWPLERLERRRVEATEVVFQLVYLGIETALQGQVLKTKWLLPFPQTLIKREWERYFGIDVARLIQHITGGSTKDPDYFALAVLVDAQPVLVLEDGVYDRVVMGDAEDAFFEMAGIYNPKLTGIEVTGQGGVEYYSALLRRMRARGLHYALRPIRTTRNKSLRLNEMAPDFQYGNVKVSDAVTPFLTAFRNAWASFPRGHDDPLDAAYNAWVCAAHLLPQQTKEAEAEARDAPRRPGPMRAIERAYVGMGKR